MSATIPKLKLFPLYPGGPMVQNTGGLNANSSYYIRATKFNPAYGVNIPPNTNPMDVDTYYTLRGGQDVVRRPISEARTSFDTNLGLDGTVIGNLKKVPVPAVAPVIPNLYEEAVKLLSISDLKFADLMAQAEFRIPGIGMGLKVTTDGLGHVDTIALNPSSRGALPGISAIGTDFGRPNMAEVTTGATFRGLDPVFNTNSGSPVTQSNSQPKKANQPDGINAQAFPQFNLNQPGRNAGIFNLERLNPLALDRLAERAIAVDPLDNPVLERLYQLQPPENGVAVSGYEAALDAEQAKQLAATQAKLNVSTSDQFRQSMAELASVATRQTESYAAAFNPKMDQLMNGKVNATPWQSGTSTSNGDLGSGRGGAFEMGGAVADAMSRKGKNSYIPFQMQSGTSGQGFGGANPFMSGGMQGGSMGFGGGQSSTGQQYPTPRRPMAFMA